MHIPLYLDPGTGSLILQLIIGAVTAIGLAFRPIVNFFKRRRKKQQEDQDE